jgi:hypothetical protein
MIQKSLIEENKEQLISLDLPDCGRYNYDQHNTQLSKRAIWKNGVLGG